MKKGYNPVVLQKDLILDLTKDKDGQYSHKQKDKTVDKSDVIKPFCHSMHK